MDKEKLRELVASPHWRWMPGMIVLVYDAGHRYRWRLTAEVMGQSIDPLPDLTDPATLGCLLALVREAWRAPVCVWWTGKTWEAEVVEHPDLDCEPYGKGSAFSDATEAEALVAALLAAPEGRDV